MKGMYDLVVYYIKTVWIRDENRMTEAIMLKEFSLILKYNRELQRNWRYNRNKSRWETKKRFERKNQRRDEALKGMRKEIRQETIDRKNNYKWHIGGIGSVK